jgi:hypothetical protein
MELRCCVSCQRPQQQHQAQWGHLQCTGTKHGSMNTVSRGGSSRTKQGLHVEEQTVKL